MARDKFHQEVRAALENDGWTITADPLSEPIVKNVFSRYDIKIILYKTDKNDAIEWVK